MSIEHSEISHEKHTRHDDKIEARRNEQDKLIKKHKALRNRIIISTTATAIGFGGIGVSLGGALGVEGRLGKELNRPTTTELAQAQEIQSTYLEKTKLYEGCSQFYGADACQNLKVEPDDKVKGAERTIAQEQVFMNEANERKDTWIYISYALYGVFGAGVLGRIKSKWDKERVEEAIRQA